MVRCAGQDASQRPGYYRAIDKSAIAQQINPLSRDSLTSDNSDIGADIALYDGICLVPNRPFNRVLEGRKFEKRGRLCTLRRGLHWPLSTITASDRTSEHVFIANWHPYRGPND